MINLFKQVKTNSRKINISKDHFLKMCIKSSLLSLALITSSASMANDKLTFGAGIGSLYSGIGINAGIQSKTDLKYVSLGCISYSSSNGETCGAGIGWVTTTLFDSKNTKHGTGMYLGIVGTENHYFDNDPIYGLGLGYHYFLNGINNSGFNLGFTLVAGSTNDGADIGGMLQAGYQF